MPGRISRRKLLKEGAKGLVSIGGAWIMGEQRAFAEGDYYKYTVINNFLIICQIDEVPIIATPKIQYGIENISDSRLERCSIRAAARANYYLDAFFETGNPRGVGSPAVEGSILQRCARINPDYSFLALLHPPEVKIKKHPNLHI